MQKGKVSLKGLVFVKIQENKDWNRTNAQKAHRAVLANLVLKSKKTRIETCLPNFRLTCLCVLKSKKTRIETEKETVGLSQFRSC